MKQPASPKRASKRLMAELPLISAKLTVTGVFRPGVHQLENVDPKLLRELGSILHSVACGENARLLFRQDERTKPKKSYSSLAFVYYYMRALSLDFSDDRAALEFVKAAKHLGAPKSDASIVKVAQQHRDKTLKSLGGMSETEAGEVLLTYAFGHIDTAAWREEWRLAPDKVTGLRRYLEKKSPHIRD